MVVGRVEQRHFISAPSLVFAQQGRDAEHLVAYLWILAVLEQHPDPSAVMGEGGRERARLDALEEAPLEARADLRPIR